MRPLRPRHGLRALAVAVLCVMVGGQLGELVHQLVERHEVCVEHGQLVHAGSAETPSRAAAAGADAFGSAPRAHAEHEHCATPCATLKAAATAGAPGVAELAPVAGAPHPALAPDRAHTPVPLLLAAPKTSPPIAC